MMRPDFHRLEQMRVERAVKVAGARFGLVRVPGVGTAASLPGARAVIEIDPVTGWPVEPDVDGLLYPGDFPGDDSKELA